MDAAAAENGGVAAGPWALPVGWAWVPLALVTRARSGNSKLIKGKLPQRRSPNLFPAFSATGQDVWISTPEHEGDAVILSAVGARCGKAFLTTGKWAAIANTHVIFPEIAAVDPRWLWYRTNDERFWLRSGSAQPFVNVGKTLERMVALAPLAEQRRIVARIDELFAEIAEGEAALAEARKGLDVFRRALLKAAVTGELTKDWRAANPISETGDEILASLRKCYPNASPTRARWKPKADLPLLPEGWTWCAIEEVGEVQLGRQRAPQHHDGDNMRPYLRVANVLEDRLDLSDVKWMNFTPAEFETFALRSGDILLNEGQAPDLLGRPAMYRDEIVECCFQKTLLRFRAKDGVLPDYALIVFRHYMRSGRFKRESRITTNIGHLTQVRFVVLEFPLPPEPEQRAIVELFRKDEAAVTDVLAMLDAEAADAARLKQSILNAAFEGRLVPQDPADEPASALLARVAAQPERNAARLRGGRKNAQ
jgi:type I restriction enzyme S subunit